MFPAPDSSHCGAGNGRMALSLGGRFVRSTGQASAASPVDFCGRLPHHSGQADDLCEKRTTAAIRTAWKLQIASVLRVRAPQSHGIYCPDGRILSSIRSFMPCVAGRRLVPHSWSCCCSLPRAAARPLRRRSSISQRLSRPILTTNSRTSSVFGLAARLQRAARQQRARLPGALCRGTAGAGTCLDVERARALVR